MTIQIKRRNTGGNAAPSTLASGELAWNSPGKSLYIGDGDNGSGGANTVLVIAGTSATTVSDVAYTVLASDRSVQYATLTAARTVTLPAASAFAAGQRVTIGDRSGACSSTNTITVARAGTSDTINGATSYVLSQSYGQVTLESDGSGKWTVVASTVVAPASNIDGGTY